MYMLVFAYVHTYEHAVHRLRMIWSWQFNLHASQCNSWSPGIHVSSLLTHCTRSFQTQNNAQRLVHWTSYRSPLSHKLKTLLTRPSHLDTYSIKCRSTYIHGHHGDFQRGTSASWYVSVDIRTRAGGSQSGDKAGSVYIVSIVALLTVWVGKVPSNRRQQFAPTWWEEWSGSSCDVETTL